MRRTTSLISLVAAVGLLAACAGGTGDDPTTDAAEPTDDTTTTSEEPSSEEPTTDAPTSGAPDDVDGPPFIDSTADQTSDQTEAALLLVDVRVAEHERFERLVLEFEGEGEPGWRVGYLGEASTQGKGEPIELEGDLLLSVSALHAMPDDMTGFYDGPRQFDPDTDVIEEVFVDGTFEGETLVVLGTEVDDDRPPRFRVFTLTGPTRLVVDVQDTGD